MFVNTRLFPQDYCVHRPIVSIFNTMPVSFSSITKDAVSQGYCVQCIRVHTVCTDGNTVFRCESDKNSLVIINMF